MAPYRGLGVIFIGTKILHTINALSTLKLVFMPFIHAHPCNKWFSSVLRPLRFLWLPPNTTRLADATLHPS